MLNYDALKYLPSLLASSCLFVAFVTAEEDPDTDRLGEARDNFDWFSLTDFRECASFVRTSWAESRNNPLMSRFEAIFNKFEGRGLENFTPTAIPLSRTQEWFYREMSD